MIPFWHKWKLEDGSLMSVMVAIFLVGALIGVSVLSFQINKSQLLVANLQNQMLAMQRVRFIDFKSAGNNGAKIISTPDMHVPGGEVWVQYILTRHLPCRTTVERRFYSFEMDRIDPSTFSMNYPRFVNAVRAPVTDTPIEFIAKVLLPLDIQAGSYSYQPVIVGHEECLETPIAVLPSEPFEVRVKD